MICTNCKSEVSDGSKFCRECGAPLPQRPVQRGMRGTAAEPVRDEDAEKARPETDTPQREMRGMAAEPVRDECTEDVHPQTDAPQQEMQEKTALTEDGAAVPGPVQSGVPAIPRPVKMKQRPAAGIVAALIILEVLLLASMGMNAYQYLCSRRDSETIAQAQLDLYDANRQISDADSALAEKESELESVRSEMADTQSALESARSEAADMQSELERLKGAVSNWRSRAEKAESMLRKMAK